MPKLYHDFMDEITPDELYNGLIEHGLFAEKLPPIFDGTEFLAFCLAPKRPIFSDIPRCYAQFNATRNINIPRTIGMPTPMSHERLCATLRKNWVEVQKHFKAKTSTHHFRKSRIHVRKKQGTSCLFEMNYGNHENDDLELDLSIGKQYLVKADISQCFPSIYSHAIPWALVGKPTAKAYRGKSLWYNDIDLKVRNSTDAETHGIHIGPHTSNILSEIILCAVDAEMNEYVFTRKIDDYEYFADSEEDAKQFLLLLNRSLNEYGLKINQKKTTIERQPAARARQWVYRVRELASVFNSSPKIMQPSDVNAILNQYISLIESYNNNASIVLYGIKMMDPEKMSSDAAVCLIKIMTSLTLLHPYLMHTIDECVYTKYGIPISMLELYIRKFFSKFFDEDCFDAAAHALQLAVKYDIVIDDFDVEKIIEKKDCILLLCALIYCRHFSLSKSLTLLKKHANILNTHNIDMEENWPFVYECLNGSLHGDWKVLKKANVSFLRKEYR